MTNHTTLFYNLMQFIGDSGVRFHDLRLFATFAWAISGLILSESVHLGRWGLYHPGTTKASSKERQLSRWLHNDRIRPMHVYRPLIEKVLHKWAGETIYLALDTSQLWNRFVIIRLALVYRGRALPVGWIVCASQSATVSVALYQRMLADVAAVIPKDSHVILLADRGFADVKLMKIVCQLGWHFRIRIKQSLWVYRATKGGRTVKALMPPPGEARFLSHVWLTRQQFGPLHLAVAHIQTKNGYQKWAIISDEPVGLDTFDEYGLRFDIEENFLDDKSAGFDLESSQIADSEALSRLCLILATATLYLVSIGTAVVDRGERHFVDTHWRRGLSYFQIGWRWIKRTLSFGGFLLPYLWLNSQADPEPAIASWKQCFEPDLRLSCIKSV